MTPARESGMALVLALVAVTAVAASVLLVARLVSSGEVSASYEYRSVMLTSLADAAFSETLARLSTDPEFRGVAARPFGDGSISSEVAVTPAGVHLVTAVGRFANWRSILTAEVAIAEDLPRIVWVSRRQVAEAR